MAFDPYAAWAAARDAGMLVAVDVETFAAAYIGVYVKWAQPDALFLESAAQQTDYHIEYRTDDLPTLTRGCLVDGLASGIVYEVIEPPAFAPNKSGGHFSIAKLKASVHAWPKAPITYASE
jgi:hypothetical protein